MTAITLTAPPRLGTAEPGVRRRSVAAAPQSRLREVPCARATAPRPGLSSRSAGPARPAVMARPASPAAAPPLRLTRRGRLLITTLLFAVGLAVTLFSGAVSLAGTHAQQVPVRYVTVAPGDTLWSIAGEAAPGADRRDTVHRIVELNALAGHELTVGQLVAVPVNG
jgi:Tfp pilus assembly protein FimV